MDEVRRLLLIAEKAVRDGLRTAEETLAAAHTILGAQQLRCPNCEAEVEIVSGPKE